MDKSKDSTFVRRHVSQLKVISRLLEHELDAGQGGKDLVLDRELGESILDTLEIFIEDIDGGTSAVARRDAAETRAPAEKPAVTRLN